MFSKENPEYFSSDADDGDDDDLPLGDEVYEPESSDETGETDAEDLLEGRRPQPRRRARRQVEFNLPTEAEMQQAAQVIISFFCRLAFCLRTAG